MPANITLWLLSTILVLGALIPANVAAQSGAVSNVTKNSATLSVSSTPNFWAYKRSAPTSGGCTRRTRNQGAQLTGLQPNTQYTYQFWGSNQLSGLNCSGNPASTVSFTTLAGEPHAPGKPSTTAGNQRAGLVWVVPNNGGSAITKFEYTKKVGNNDFETTWTTICETATNSYCPNLTFRTVTGLAGGVPYKFKLRAVNSNGNGPASPETDVVTPNGTTTFSANSVTQKKATLSLSGYSGAWWYKGNQSGDACTPVAAGTRTVNLTGLTPGTAYTYGLFFYADCTSGLEIKSVSFTTVQGVAFNATSITSKRYIVNQSITPVVLPDAIGGTGSLTYSLTPSLPTGLNFDSNTRTLSGTPSVVTDQTTYTYAVSDANNNSDQLTFDITVSPGTAPIFSDASIPDLYFTENRSIKTVVLPQAIGGTGDLQYSLDPTLPQGLSFNSGTRTLSGTPTESAARTRYTYTVTDGQGATDRLYFDIAVEANLAPSFAGRVVGDMRFLENEPIESFALPAASGGNGDLQYALTPGLPEGLRFDPATRSVSGTPTVNLARSEYTYSASDEDGDVAQLTFGITVEADIVPIFGSAAVDELKMTQHRSFESEAFPAASEGNGALTYRITPALPDGLTFDGGTRVLYGTPTVTQGKSWYTYQAVDEQGDTADLPFAITIAPNLLPSFQGATIAEQQYKQNRPIESLMLPAATGGDGTVTYSVTPALPDGLSFDPATRVLAGTPTAALERTGFTYAATDEEGDAATLSLFITVKGDLAPDFAGVTEVQHTFKQNRDIGQIVLPAAAGGDGDVRYAITPELPRGLTFDGVTRILSGIPTKALDRTEFTYTATDEDGDTGQVPLYITVEADLMPDFEGAVIAEQLYKQNRDIGQVVLPGAASGDGELHYSVSPALPEGLTLDASTHTLSGTPTTVQIRTKYTYSVTDEDGDAAHLALYITVEADLMPDFEQAAIAEQVYTQNQTIDNLILPQAVSGDGTLTYALTPTLPEGLTFDAGTRVVSGTPAVALDRTEFTYSVADEDGDSDQLTLHITVEADLMPDFQGAAVAEQQYKQNTPIDALTLPEATGGDGSLTYSVSPALPQGLAFDASTRVVSGTPTAPQDRTEFTYEVTDEDGDAAQLMFYIEVEADLAPSFEGQSIADIRLGRGRAMEPVTLPAASGGDGAIAYVLAPELPGGLSYNAGTRTISGTPNELGGPWTFTYTATDADVVSPDAVSLSFSISVVILEEDKTVLSDILSAQGRALLNGATSAIGQRFSGASGASNNQSSALNTIGGWLANAYSHSGDVRMLPMAGSMPMMAGPFNAAGTVGPSVGMTHSTAGLNGIHGMNHGTGWQRLLQDQSFTLSANTTSQMQLMRFTVWSAVDYQSFSGASESNDFEGGMASIYLGGDVQFNANWLAGAAVSSNSGTSDYTVMGRSGELKTSLISVYPYVHGKTGSGMELWFIGGFGSGEAEDLSQHAGATAEASDLSMTMGAAGLRQPVSQISGMDLSIVGGVGILSMTTNDGQNAIDGLDAGVSQARVGAEIGRNTSSMSPYLRLSGRYDGGGSQSGGGLEVVGGLRYASDKIDFEAQGRWLAVHSAADYQEFGGMARLLYKSRPDGTGLQMSVQPGWGEASGGALFGRSNSLLGGPNLRTMLPVGREIASQPLVLDNDVGYGFMLGRGLLTLGARQYRLGRFARESVGLKWQVSDLSSLADTAIGDLAFRLDFERPQPYMGGSLRAELRYALRL